MRLLNSALSGDKLTCRPLVFCALKISALIFTSMLVSFSSASAYQITLEWDSNVEQDLAGYIVYYGTASRNYKYDVDVGDETSCAISNLYSGTTYYFAVTAYDIDGNESPYSAEITFPESSSGGNFSVSGGGGSGRVVCFISAAAEEKNSVFYFLGFTGVLLAVAAANELFKRMRCRKPAGKLP